MEEPIQVLWSEKNAVIVINDLAGKLWKRTDLWWKENQIDFLVGKV